MVGEETLSRRFRGDVGIKFKDIVSGSIAGDGRDDVGL
jgi:hypothetical protein